MFRLFRKKVDRPAATPPDATPQGFTRPQSALSLLSTQRRQMLLEHIWQRTSLSRPQFATLYQQPLERYVALVQQLPASESHHHAYPGGMLDHGLEIVAYALKLRQSRLLPVGTTPEDQAAQTEVWTAATAYAALLHDLGKIAVDLHVELADGCTWHPWHGPLTQPYRFRYREGRAYRLHSAATGLLYMQVLDSKILDWLSEHQQAWSSLLYVLAGQYEHAGVLGELVVQADQASVAQELGGDPAKALAAPKHTLQRKLLDGLRYLLKEEFKLNQLQASDGWLTQDALWLVSKTVSDKLRAHLLSQGIDGIPSSNTTLFTILQDHGMVQATAEGKAIWRATVAGENGWSNTFTFLKLAPALIWDDATQRPSAFAGAVTVEANTMDSEHEAEQTAAPITKAPASVVLTAPTSATTVDTIADLLTMFDSAVNTSSPPVTEQNSPISPALALEPHAASVPEAPASSSPLPPMTRPPLPPLSPSITNPSGEHFVAWLRHAVQTRKLVINDAKALVHTVTDTVYLVSPGVFQRYAQEHPAVERMAKADGVADWQWVQKRFEQLRLHRKQADGLNIWTCEVTGPRKSKRLHGYLINEQSALFDKSIPNNPYLTIIASATPARGHS